VFYRSDRINPLSLRVFIVTRTVLLTKNMVVTQQHHMPGLAIHTHAHTYIGFSVEQNSRHFVFQSSIFPGATVTCHCRARPKRRGAPRIAVTLQSINSSITTMLLYRPMANSMIYRTDRRKASRSLLMFEGTECFKIRSSILLFRVIYSLYVYACIALLLL
jgi:hypothetical protein